ncbi:MAG TPA: hypothetical protein VGA80_04565 [Flavobacteriaceae bacterium]
MSLEKKIILILERIKQKYCEQQMYGGSFKNLSASEASAVAMGNPRQMYISKTLRGHLDNLKRRGVNIKNISKDAIVDAIKAINLQYSAPTVAKYVRRRIQGMQTGREYRIPKRYEKRVNYLAKYPGSVGRHYDIEEILRRGVRGYGLNEFYGTGYSFPTKDGSYQKFTMPDNLLNPYQRYVRHNFKAAEAATTNQWADKPQKAKMGIIMRTIAAKYQQDKMQNPESFLHSPRYGAKLNWPSYFVATKAPKFQWGGKRKFGSEYMGSPPISIPGGTPPIGPISIPPLSGLTKESVEPMEEASPLEELFLEVRPQGKFDKRAKETIAFFVAELKKGGKPAPQKQYDKEMLQVATLVMRNPTLYGFGFGGYGFGGYGLSGGQVLSINRRLQDY